MYNVVVKLFNAVNKHQKELDAKLKTAPTEAKKAKGIEKNLFNRVINTDDVYERLNYRS